MLVPAAHEVQHFRDRCKVAPMTMKKRAYVPMSTEEVADALQMSYDTARSRMLRVGRGTSRRGFPTPKEKLGGIWLFDEKVVNRFIKDHGAARPAR